MAVRFFSNSACLEVTNKPLETRLLYFVFVRSFIISFSKNSQYFFAVSSTSVCFRKFTRNDLLKVPVFWSVNSCWTIWWGLFPRTSSSTSSVLTPNPSFLYWGSSIFSRTICCQVCSLNDSLVASSMFVLPDNLYISNRFCNFSS